MLNDRLSRISPKVHPSSKYPRDCQDVLQNGQTESGLYTVYMPEEGDIAENAVLKSVSVYCDMDTAGGGWLTVLNRQDAKHFDFEKNNWVEYEEGFGNPSGSHWLGNKYISGITSQKQLFR